MSGKTEKQVNYRCLFIRKVQLNVQAAHFGSQQYITSPLKQMLTGSYSAYNEQKNK